MNSNKPRVLLIDDDSECLNVISKALTLFGYPNEKFSDPRAAIVAFRSEKFDVVITDYKMPEMNGFEVLEEVKRHAPSTHVIILTGYADKSNAISALNSGAYAFFAKPLNLKSLIGKISEIEKEQDSIGQ